MSDQESVEERLEYWIGERDAVQRSLDSLRETLGEINENIEELAELADTVEAEETSLQGDLYEDD